MKSGAVSVLTVSFNAVATIRRTIESVLTQKGVAVEYIVIDGGSTDGTKEIIEEYADRLAFWISEPDEGIYDAMNKGLSHASGDLIGILNADDMYLPGVLEFVWNEFSRSPGAVLHGDIEIVDHGHVVDVWKGRNPVGVQSQFRKMTVNHPATFIPRQVYKKFGNYLNGYSLSADYELVLRLISNGVPFVYLDRTFTRFSLGGSSGGVKTYQQTLDIQRCYGRGFLESLVWYWVSLFKMHVAKRLPTSLVSAIRSRSS